MKKKKKNNLSVNEYKIKYFLKTEGQRIHKRYFQATNLKQIKDNLREYLNIASEDGYGIVSIEQYDPYSEKWELVSQ